MSKKNNRKSAVTAAAKTAASETTEAVNETAAEKAAPAVEKAVAKNTKKASAGKNRASSQSKAMDLAALGLLTAITFLMGFTPIGFVPIGVLKITFMTIPVIVAAVILRPAYAGVIGGMFGITSFIQAATGASALTGSLFQVSPWLTFLLCVVPRVLEGLLGGLIFQGLSKLRGKPVFSYAVKGTGTGFLLSLSVFLMLLVFDHYRNDLVMAFALMALITTAIGALTGLAYYGMKKLGESDIFVYLITSLSVPLMNTLFFMSALYAEFRIIAASGMDTSGVSEDFIKTFTGVADKAGSDVITFFFGLVGAQAVIEAAVCFVVGTAIVKALSAALKTKKNR